MTTHTLQHNVEPAVLMENISIRYRSPVEPINSFKEYSIQLLKHNIKMMDFWALNQINLDIYRGECFGIIGRNGAGKSTLLKIISRVVSPTIGRIVTRGNVVPLLELGAGFHPELTGRENIFLNASLLGHSKKEIRSHFFEILDFAQIDGYIDAPLRTYSNGMVARLGFAIATSWDADILILDEILSVGDEEFKKKCLKKLSTFRGAGTTIILVTHNLETITEMCDRALWLDRGNSMAIGEVDTVVNAYLNDIHNAELQPSGR